jgi:hypothetical protein
MKRNIFDIIITIVIVFLFAFILLGPVERCSIRKKKENITNIVDSTRLLIDTTVEKNIHLIDTVRIVDTLIREKIKTIDKIVEKEIITIIETNKKQDSVLTKETIDIFLKYGFEPIK